MNSLAEQIIVNIINFEMDMPANKVWVRDQNVLFNNDSGPFIVVGMITSQAMGNETYMEERMIPNPPGPDIAQQWQVQQIVTREDIQIDILSRDTSALTRRDEILMALSSFYSQQLQELNSFKIFPISNSFINTSDAEGGSNINRFSITVACHSWYRKEKALSLPSGDYYDTFSTRVDDELSIGTDHGIIEFTIP